MSVRAGIVVTGTEVLSGRVADRNGPWLAERLAELGADVAHILTCGDRPADLMAALQFLRAQKVALVVTSGGLGPTADDLTAEVVAQFSGRRLVLDERLERRIAEILSGFARRWRLDPEALGAANRKQATVPDGANVLGPIGTAPGLVVPTGEQVIVVLPGPPAELRRTWAEAVRTEPLRAVLGKASNYERRTLRLFGIPESEIAQTLRVAEQSIELSGLEITTCMRRGELEVAIRNEPEGADAAAALQERIAGRHPDTLFSTDGSSIDDQVAELLRGRRVAVAESCTAGLLAARLTERPGSSEYFAGGVVAYSDDSKIELVGVPRELLERHGAVSAEVAEALADGAIRRFSADVGIGLTGIAGPGGGSADKPVGRVCFCVKAYTDGRIPALVRTVDLPGARHDVRDRSTTVALHLLRRLLRGEGAPEQADDATPEKGSGAG